MSKRTAAGLRKEIAVLRKRIKEKQAQAHAKYLEGIECNDEGARLIEEAKALSHRKQELLDQLDNLEQGR